MAMLGTPLTTRIADQARSLGPGLLLAAVVACAATFISEHYGAPVMLMALLLGITFHFLWEEGPCAPGIDFAAKTLLRLGVGLLGMRITFEQIAAIGFGPLALVLICVPATIGCGLLLARLLGKHWSFGLVAGGAVAICGASAALAISAVLPERPSKEQDTLFTVIAVTSLSTVAMIVYPLLFTVFGFDDREIGIMLGATIHDVAQVVGAGYAVSDTAGDTATIVKLVRVALLPVVILAILFLGNSTGEGGRRSLPWFVILFAALAFVGSLGIVPDPVSAFVALLSRWLLVVAIAALGVKTSLKYLLSLGGGHVSLVVATTVFLMTLALALSVFL